MAEKVLAKEHVEMTISNRNDRLVGQGDRARPQFTVNGVRTDDPQAGLSFNVQEATYDACKPSAGKPPKRLRVTLEVIEDGE